MKTEIKNHRALTIANTVLSIIFGVITAFFASFLSIFNTEEIIGIAFGVVFVAIFEFIFVLLGLIWLVINFLYLAKMHETDIGLGSKRCSIFYGIVGGVVGAAIISFITAFILMTVAPDYIDYVTWVSISVYADVVAAVAFIASFIFTLIHFKRM